MKDRDFEELITSVREGGRILRGEVAPARRHTVKDLPAEQRAIVEARGEARLSQPDFAEMLGVSVGTYRGWEQGRRKPTGPARVLIEVIRRNPKVVREAAAGIAATARRAANAKKAAPASKKPRKTPNR